MEEGSREAAERKETAKTVRVRRGTGVGSLVRVGDAEGVHATLRFTRVRCVRVGGDMDVEREREEVILT